MLTIIKGKYGASATGLLPDEFVTYECTVAFADFFDQLTEQTNTAGGCATAGAGDSNAICDDDDELVHVAAMSTSQNFVPNDSATLAGLATPAGNLRFQLFKTAGACDDDAVTGNRIYDSGNIAVNANSTFGTTNAALLSALNATNANVSAGTAGTYKWLVTYDDTADDDPDITSTCGIEKFVVDNG